MYKWVISLGILLLPKIVFLETSLDNSSLSGLFDAWKDNFDDIQRLEDDIQEYRNKPTLESYEERFLKDRQKELRGLNQKRWDMESLMDRKMTRSNQKVYGEYWDMIKAFQSQKGIEIMTYWDSSNSLSTKSTWDDMYNKPELFRNAYYFLKETSLSSSMHEAILFTKTPPEGVKSPMDYKKVDCREEMFGNKTCNHKKEGLPKYVIYIDPTLSAKDMIDLFEERVRLRIVADTPKNMEILTGEVNPGFPCYGDLDSNNDRSLTLETIVEQADSRYDNVFGAYKPNLILLRQNIKFKLYEKLREVELGSNVGTPENDEERKKIEQMIQGIEKDQLPRYARFSNFNGVLQLWLNEQLMSDDAFVIDLPEIYVPPKEE